MPSPKGQLANRMVVTAFMTLTVTASAAPTITLSPSKIQTNDTYRLYIDVPDGTQLDYQARSCPLDISSWSEDSGPWGDYVINDGYVDVAPPPGGWDPGIILARFKVRGAAASEYSNWDAQMVDTLPTINPNVVYGPDAVTLPPVGSYMIFENYGPNDEFLGYTRIEVESDPCTLTGGYTMRYSKTGDNAYWNPTGPAFLRGCNRIDSTPAGPMLVLPGSWIHGGDVAGECVWDNWAPLTQVATPIDVTYESDWNHADRQGLLGAYPTGCTDGQEYSRDADMSEHYAILPPYNKIPATLPNPPGTGIVELGFGHPFLYPTALDVWHCEALAPSRPDSDLRMRYVEVGVHMEYGASLIWWTVTEDWDWREDGILTRIRQWQGVDPLCWRDGYRCDTTGYLTCDTQLIDWYIPDNNPLTVGFEDPATGAFTDRMSYTHGDPQKFIVKLADGRAYHGFLELELNTGQRLLWVDHEGKPIYVSNGTVTLGPAAYGPPTGYRSWFKARPYLANSTLNALYPVNEAELLPNDASTTPFSNPAILYMDVFPPDFDTDDDVDYNDLVHIVGCMTGYDVPITDPACHDADLDGDDDADQSDFGLFQRCLSGAANPPLAGCME